MAVNISKEAFEKRKILKEGEVELSPRKYNLILGGVLLWGFVLNWLMIEFLERPILRAVGSMNPLVFLLVYLGLALTGSFLISKDSPALSLLGFHLIAVPLGVVVCIALQGQATETVQSAVMLTAFVTVTFMALGMLFPSFFLSLGRMLLIGLLASAAVELLAALILHRSFAIMDWVVVAIFSLYIGYDWARANTCARTLNNAIDLAANLYLDIINIFLRILSILSKRKD